VPDDPNGSANDPYPQDLPFEPSWCPICGNHVGPFTFDPETWLWTCPGGHSWKPEPRR
jgi:hypothetical protein